MDREEILKELIKGYRQTIEARYQYAQIKKSYNIPESITEETVVQLREYFLNHMYPDYVKRQSLNESFKSLDGFIKNPKKLLSILVNTTKLIFKYGRHLPKLLNSGLSAMKSFRAATQFENKLVDEAINSDIYPPYNSQKIDLLIKSLPQTDIDNFINTTQSLFEILHDRTLIKKTKDIIQFLISAMEEKPNHYSSSEIQGLRIGYEMLFEGDTLFNQLSSADQRNLINIITVIERDNIDRIFK